MLTKRLSIFFTLICLNFSFCQSSKDLSMETNAVIKFPIIFSYDEAGNQIYRGYSTFDQEQGNKTEENKNSVSEEDKFWLGVNIYPVPVKNVLTIAWNSENNDLIENVSLYQHSTLSSLFTQKNLPNLNSQIQINMTSYYMGVYILNFQLKDGRVMSRNIIKE